jgi:hypothetical protein
MGRRVSVIVDDRQDGYFREIWFQSAEFLLQLKL